MMARVRGPGLPAQTAPHPLLRVACPPPQPFPRSLPPSLPAALQASESHPSGPHNGLPNRNRLRFPPGALLSSSGRPGEGSPSLACAPSHLSFHFPGWHFSCRDFFFFFFFYRWFLFGRRRPWASARCLPRPPFSPRARRGHTWTGTPAARRLLGAPLSRHEQILAGGAGGSTFSTLVLTANQRVQGE